MTKHRDPAGAKLSRKKKDKREKYRANVGRRSEGRKRKLVLPPPSPPRPQPADATTSFVHDGFQRDNARKRETKRTRVGEQSKRGKRSTQRSRHSLTDRHLRVKEKERETEKKTRGRERRKGDPTRWTHGPIKEAEYRADVITTAARDRSSCVSSSCAVLSVFHHPATLALFSHIDKRKSRAFFCPSANICRRCSSTRMKRKIDADIYLYTYMSGSIVSLFDFEMTSLSETSHREESL